VAEELNFADVAGVMLAYKEVAFTIHRDGSVFAYPKLSRGVKPSAVSGMGIGG